MNPFRDSSFSVPFGFALSNAALDPYANPFAEAIYAGLAGRERARQAQLEEEELERQRKRQEEIDQRAREQFDMMRKRFEQEQAAIAEKPFLESHAARMQRGAERLARGEARRQEAMGNPLEALGLTSSQTAEIDAARDLGYSAAAQNALLGHFYKPPMTREDRLRNELLEAQIAATGRRGMPEVEDPAERIDDEVRRYKRIYDEVIEPIKSPYLEMTEEQKAEAKAETTRRFVERYGRQPFELGGRPDADPGGRVDLGAPNPKDNRTPEEISQGEQAILAEIDKNKDRLQNPATALQEALRRWRLNEDLESILGLIRG